MSEIILFGATGFTGQLVAEALHARGLPFVIAGRSAERLEALAARVGGPPIRVADAELRHTLPDLVRGGKVLVNCAGPFLRYGEPVVAASVEAGLHYIDTTGEQSFMKAVLDRYDGAALRAKVTIINALAFEYAIGDWLAAYAAQQIRGSAPLDSLSIGYALSGGGISQGTALSLLEMAGEPGWSYEGGHWRKRPAGWTSRTLPFPFGEREVTWVPFGEVLSVPRHTSVQTVLTYMRLPERAGRALALAAPLGSLARRALRPFARRVIARRPEGPTAAQRELSRFTLVAEARRGESEALVTATGSDPYGITAQIAVLGAELLLTEKAPRGVRTPAHLPLSPAEALERVGVEVANGNVETLKR